MNAECLNRLQAQLCGCLSKRLLSSESCKRACNFYLHLNKNSDVCIVKAVASHSSLNLGEEGGAGTTYLCALRNIALNPDTGIGYICEIFWGTCRRMPSTKFDSRPPDRRVEHCLLIETHLILCLPATIRRVSDQFDLKFLGLRGLPNLFVSLLPQSGSVLARSLWCCLSPKAVGKHFD